MNLSIYPYCGRTVDRSQHFGRHTTNDSMRRDVGCYHGTGSYNSPFTNPYAICYDSTSSNPDIIFNHNTVGSYTLIDHWHGRIIEDVVDCEHLHQRRSIDAISDRDAPLTAQDIHLPDQTVGPDMDEGVGQVAEVVDMQHRTVHDERIITDLNAVRTGMQIDAVVKIHISPESDVIGKANSDIILDRSNAIHSHEKAIAQRPQSDTEKGWHPANQQKYQLFDCIPEGIARLPANVESNSLAGAAGNIHA